MRALFSFFQRLQWKLTISYVVVTVGTVMVLGVLTLGIVVFAENQINSRVFKSMDWSMAAFEANIPDLMDDPEALQSWLTRVQAAGFSVDDLGFIEGEWLPYANTLARGTKPIYLLDPDLNLIAAAPLDDPAAIGKPIQMQALDDPGYVSLLSSGILTEDSILHVPDSGLGNSYYVVSAPMRDDDGNSVAIILYAIQPVAFTLPADFSMYVLLFVAVSMLALVAVLPIGAVFGWLASRGLRSRLVNLSVAAKAWSKGDFSPAPRDRSADEIGALTRSLVNMAGQLQTLLHTRDELARIEERNRLARDLHDTVKQQTYAARMQLSAARNLLPTDTQAAAEHLEAALQLNRETQQELKLIIDELRPAALEGKGLAQALKAYIIQWQEHTGIQVEALTAGSEHPLPLEVEQALYRILQESLSNVARHAEAETVSLNLNITPQQVTLTIADDGRGFEIEAVSPHALGLAGMRQHLGEVGGALRVRSAPAAGTTITAEVPLIAIGKK